MAEFDVQTRARTAYDRCKWLSAVSGFSIIFLLGTLFNAETIPAASLPLLVLGLIGLAFTLFVTIGIQIVVSAADRWITSDTVPPLLLIWEWRLLALAHFTFMLSILILLIYFLNNLPPV